jgi:hypothetical protein
MVQLLHMSSPPLAKECMFDAGAVRTSSVLFKCAVPSSPLQVHALPCHALPPLVAYSLVGQPMRAMFPPNEFPSDLKLDMSQGNPVAGKFLLGAGLTILIDTAGLIPALQLQAAEWATSCAKVTLHLRLLKTVQVCVPCARSDVIVGVWHVGIETGTADTGSGLSRHCTAGSCRCIITVQVLLVAGHTHSSGMVIIVQRL